MSSSSSTMMPSNEKFSLTEWTEMRTPLPSCGLPVTRHLTDSTMKVPVRCRIYIPSRQYITAFSLMRNPYLNRKREREMFYLTTHSTDFTYSYMASDIWLRTILIVRKETRCRHIGYSYRLTARVLLYAPSHRQDNTYHGLCYTSRGALAGTRK